MSAFVEQLEEMDRCVVCAMPLPRAQEEAKVCSRRCASLRKQSGAIWNDREKWARQIETTLKELGPQATMCPGELSRRLLPKTDKPLTVFRPLLYQLADEGRVRLSQGGVKTRWEKIRGPFRIRRQ